MMRSLILSLAAALLLHAEASVSASGQTRETARPASLPQEVRSLPSLKSHMARLGTLMNLLFREIGDAKKAQALVQATREMDALLARAAGFRPDSAAFTPDAQSEAAVMRGFRACLQRAREVLARLREALPAAREGEARQRLLELDRLRRRCHAAFG